MSFLIGQRPKPVFDVSFDWLEADVFLVCLTNQSSELNIFNITLKMIVERIRLGNPHFLDEET